jgi:hypothetical protein
MIGFRVLSLLLKDGYRVRVVVRNAASFERLKGLKSVASYISQMSSVIVPDITLSGAYDEALEGGVKDVVHIASPLAHSDEGDYDDNLVVPAVKGTIGMLESAAKISSVGRIVFTASILSISTLPEIMSGTVINGMLCHRLMFTGMTQKLMWHRELPNAQTWRPILRSNDSIFSVEGAGIPGCRRVDGKEQTAF